MTKPLDIVVNISIAAPVPECFNYIVPVKLAHIFRPYLLLPGVKHTDEAERWATPDISRTVYFTDGSTAKEELLTVEPPQSFTYRISAFTGINKFLVSHINGTWQFTPNNDKTDIKWTYSLICHNTVARFAAKVVVAPMLRRYLQRALQILEADLEKKNV